ARARRACLKRHGRTPGKVRRLRARALSRTRVVLTFDASGSDRQHAPPARTYLVKQSLRPIRRGRDFARAPALCRGACRFSPTTVGTKLTLTVTGLRPRTTYYFAVAARDNVSRRRGPRSLTVRVRTR
ncbi:MAG: fibronectin type III domain-containing protein, partial [Solirubrobacteraceae bacterium]